MLLNPSAPRASRHVTLPALVLILSWPLTCSHGLWTFNVTWPGGNVTSFGFPKTPYGDCLYDRGKDLLTCMRNHSYQSVVSAWTYDPELIWYVSVRCQTPSSRFPLSPPACFCKEKRHIYLHPDHDKVSDGGPSREGFFACQLQQLAPDVLEDLEELQVLDLSHNLLQEISASAFHNLRDLRVLSLENNPLHELPEGLTCQLTSLEVLDVSGLRLESFPAHTFHCGLNASRVSSLLWLDVSNSHIRAMPHHGLWDLGALRFLNLSGNSLQWLPPHLLLGAVCLTAIDTSHNLLTSLPSAFCEDESELQILLLTGNRLETLRLESLEVCGSLTDLDVSRNVISVFQGPPARLPRLRRLRLSHNLLQTVRVPLLMDGNSLCELDLSSNDLQHIGDGIFDSLSSLESLSLGTNSLNDRSANLSRVFMDLTSLRVLNLSRNFLNSIASTDFSGLRSLLTLDLSSNHISELSFAFNGSLSQLRTLNLSKNFLTYMSATFFTPLTNLRELFLSDNVLLHLDILQLPASLVTLELDHNFLREVPGMGPGVSRLRELRLAWNDLATLDEDSFGPDLGGLEILDLSHNNLTNLGASAFRCLPRLRSLTLAGNRLVLNGSCCVGEALSGLGQLQHLNLSHNQVSDVKPLFHPSPLLALLELDLSYNPIGQISDRLNVINSTMHLQQLLLNGCVLREVSTEAFSGLIYLRTVSLQNNLLQQVTLFKIHPGVSFLLQGNPLTCSCHEAWLARATVEVQGQNVSTSDYHVNACKIPPRDIWRHVRELHSRDFLCLSTSACPPKCTCYSQSEVGDSDNVFCQTTSVPNVLPKTARVISLERSDLGKVDIIGDDHGEMKAVELYLNSSGISALSAKSFAFLPHLLVLQLSDNLLTELPESLLAPLNNLSSLWLSNNRLTTLPDGLLSASRRLRLLDLSHNFLQTLPAKVVRELRRMVDLQVVLLGNNSWRCTCKNAELYHWLQENTWRVPDRDSVTCAEGSGNRAAAVMGRPVLSLQADAFLCDQAEDDREGIPIETIVGASLAAACAGILCACAYRYRRVLGAVLYTRLGLLCVKPDRHDLPLGRRYDVVVLYDHSDRKCRWWVERVLVPRLTVPSRPLRVHVPSSPTGEGGWGRFAQPQGSSEGHQSSAVAHGVREGAVCLVLVSKTFGAHHYAVGAFQQAAREAQGRPCGLVLVTWGELTKQTLECGLREYMGGGQHLPITAPFFWDRLLYMLPVPSALAPRRRSLIAACRFRSLSDAPCEEDASAITVAKSIQPTSRNDDASHHV